MSRLLDMISLLGPEDPRVTDWPLMQAPATVALILALYLCFSMWWGPRFMKHRQAYQLKTPMLVYNAANVALSAWLVYECLMGGWWRDYNLRCQPMDYTPKGYRMARMSWVYFLCKMLDLMDTVFFVLRKKDEQVTYLHLYHHATMPVCSWLAVRISPGGHAMSGEMLNSLVHVFMYSYYLLSALGPAVQRHLWWKRYLTSMQLVQFVLMVVHQSQVLVFPCDYPLFVPLMQIGQATYFFYLFRVFYGRSYPKKDRQSSDDLRKGQTAHQQSNKLS